VKEKMRVPAIINVFSGIFIRALPIKGFEINEKKKKIPMRTPISVSVDPNLER
jgi:hypothetical protein